MSHTDYEPHHFAEGEYRPLEEYEFIGGDDDECLFCNYDYKKYLTNECFVPEGMLTKRYTTFYDGRPLHFFKHNICFDCYIDKYECTHPTEPDEEMITLSKHQDAIDKISDWFLRVKYDPSYKYCRRRVDALYDEEYDNEEEGEIIRQKLHPKDIYKKWYQNI